MIDDGFSFCGIIVFSEDETNFEKIFLEWQVTLCSAFFQLYCVEPSGITYGYWGCAAGKAKQSAKTEIEKMTLKDMSCKDLIKEAAKIIYMIHDEVKDKMFELELSWVGEHTGGKHERVSQEVFDEAEKFAKASLEDDSDSDDEDMS